MQGAEKCVSDQRFAWLDKNFLHQHLVRSLETLLLRLRNQTNSRPDLSALKLQREGSATNTFMKPIEQTKKMKANIDSYDRKAIDKR